MEQQKKYGWYSAQAAHLGTSIWLTPDGKEVEICSTDVSNDPDKVDYQWFDKVCVGEIVKWVRTGHKSEFHN